MGMHPNGILYFGYHLPAETELPEEVTELYSDDEPVLVGNAYSYEYPVPYIYVVESEVYSYEAEHKAIATTTSSVQWDLMLEEFAEKHGIPKPGTKIDDYGGEASEIGWWLTAFYG